MAGIAKAQTTKQAKAAFAARGRPSLNAKEQRQLERSLELEQRAEKAKEQEKRRLAAAKKRAESECKSRSVAEREKSFLGTQRRKDRFGYVSSQFHLGKFFGGARKDQESVGEQVTMEEEDDVFGDEELDDEDMLNALDGPAEMGVSMNEHPKSESDMVMPPPPVPVPIRRSQSAPILDEDIDDFWDDLESSTQIARELGDSREKEETAAKSASTRSTSFGSVDFDFDLTAEDLDQLDPPAVLEPRPLPEKRMMPPPSPMQKATMLPPPAPKRQMETVRHSLQQPTRLSAAVQPHSAPPAPIAALDRPRNTTMPPARTPNIVARRSASNFSAWSSVSQIQQKTSNVTTHQHKSTSEQVHQRASPLMPPPAPRTAIKGPFLPASSLYCSPDLGFTLTQLESFVDDDIQLTQAIPG